MGVDYDGDVGPFFKTIAYQRQFDDDRENPLSMRGKGHIGVQDQAGGFVITSNDNIDAMKKDGLYAEIFREV